MKRNGQQLSPAWNCLYPPIDVNVRRRGFHPFFSGFAVGAAGDNPVVCCFGLLILPI